MKTKLQQFVAAMLVSLVTATAHARAIPLPTPSVAVNQTGTFSVNADSQITLTGSPVNLITSKPFKGDIASGSARFMDGDLHYQDGSSSLDGKLSKVSLGNQVKNGQVTYIIKGLVYGKLTQAGQNIDVNGSLLVTTKPMAEGTPLIQTQVESSQFLLTPRSNINNTNPDNSNQQHSSRKQKH